MKTLLCYFNVDGFAISIKNHIEDALTDLEIEWKECHISELQTIGATFQPTMTIFFHPNALALDFWVAIEQFPGHKLVWDMESPYESDLVFNLAELCHYVFISDEETANRLRDEYPENKVIYVPHACNPKVHKPEEVSWEYRSDILFVGNAYESRIKWFEDHAKAYKDKLVTIIGVGYRGLDGYQHQKVIHGHISEPEMVRYINGAKLVLNLHRQSSDLDMANERGINPSSLNNRFFEVASCGRPQLVVGRGEAGQFDASSMVYEQLETFQKENSYKARLVKYYLPLLKKK